VDFGGGIVNLALSELLVLAGVVIAVVAVAIALRMSGRGAEK
jgi:hypothetical protein